jgi:hypothetical protein
MTNEFNTSKTCGFCLGLIRLAEATKVIDGVKKFVAVHEAVETV